MVTQIAVYNVTAISETDIREEGGGDTWRGGNTRSAHGEQATRDMAGFSHLCTYH